MQGSYRESQRSASRLFSGEALPSDQANRYKTLNLQEDPLARIYADKQIMPPGY